MLAHAQSQSPYHGAAAIWVWFVLSPGKATTSLDVALWSSPCITVKLLSAATSSLGLRSAWSESELGLQNYKLIRSTWELGRLVLHS